MTTVPTILTHAADMPPGALSLRLSDHVRLAGAALLVFVAC